MGKKRAPKEFQKILDKSWESNIQGSVANRAKSPIPAIRNSAQLDIRKTTQYGPESAVRKAERSKKLRRNK